MPTYITLANFTDQGIRNFKDTPKRAQAFSDLVEENDYQVSAAGGLPGEMNMGWQAKSVSSFDVEYGYSCMGYEIADAWGVGPPLP